MAKVAKKESKWRIAAASVGGFAAFLVLAMAANWILGFVDPEVRTARETPTYYYIVVTVFYALSAFVGGYWCAKIALTAHRQAALGMICVGELLVVFTAVSFWALMPHFALITLLIAYPGMVWIGAQFRVKRHPVKPLMVRAAA